MSWFEELMDDFLETEVGHSLAEWWYGEDFEGEPEGYEDCD